MTRVFLAAGVAALAITAPANAGPKQDRQAARAERQQAQPQRQQAQRQQAPRAQRQMAAPRMERAQRQMATPRMERAQRQMAAPRMERAQRVAFERPQRAELFSGPNASRRVRSVSNGPRRGSPLSARLESSVSSRLAPIVSNSNRIARSSAIRRVSKCRRLGSSRPKPGRLSASNFALAARRRRCRPSASNFAVAGRVR